MQMNQGKHTPSVDKIVVKIQKPRVLYYTEFEAAVTLFCHFPSIMNKRIKR